MNKTPHITPVPVHQHGDVAAIRIRLGDASRGAIQHLIFRDSNLAHAASAMVVAICA